MVPQESNEVIILRDASRLLGKAESEWFLPATEPEYRITLRSSCRDARLTSQDPPCCLRKATTRHEESRSLLLQTAAILSRATACAFSRA